MKVRLNGKLTRFCRGTLCVLLAMVIAAALMPCGGMRAFAADNLTCKLEDGVLTISADGGSIGKTDIPSALGSNPSTSEITSIVINPGITALSENAFSDFSNLTSVSLPDTVTSIGKQAFWLCPKLISVNIPDSVTSIGEGAFSSTGLTSVNIPGSVSSMGEMIFGSCSSLSSVTIGNGITQLPGRMFYGCDSLNSVSLPGTLKTIGYSAFCNCTSLSSIDLPSSVESIENNAFNNCKSLTGINLPTGLTNIEYSTFSLCSNLFSIVIPEGVTEIRSNAFLKCTSLASVSFSSSVETIGTEAFKGCTTLNSVTLPEGLKYVEKGAFSGTSITKLVIPENTVSIFSNSFPINQIQQLEIKGSKLTVDNPAQFNLSSSAELILWRGFELNGTEINRNNVADIYNFHGVNKWKVTFKYISEVPASDATCTEKGHIAYKLGVLSKKYSVDDTEDFSDPLTDAEVYNGAPALGHDLSKKNAVSATCTKAGNTEYWECSRCGKYFSDAEGTNEINESDTVIPAAGHKLSKIEAKAASCEEDGVVEHYECSVCGKSFKDSEGVEEMAEADTVVKAYGHDWDSGTITKEATRHEKGIITYTCRYDSSHTKTEEIPVITTENGYSFITSGHAYTLRSGKTVLMTVKRSSEDNKTYEKFEELLVDGNVVPASSYDKASGSVKLTLKSSYLDKLSKGTHSVRFNFVNGYAESTLKVTGSGSGTTPGTGDDTRTNDLVSVMILFIVSLSFVSYTLYANKLARAKLLAVFSGAQADVQEDGSDDIMPKEHLDDGFDDIIADEPADDGFDEIIG